MSNKSSQQDPGAAARYFLQRVHHCPVPIGRQRLRDLKESRAAKDNAANKKKAARVGESEKGAEERECKDVLETRIGLHFRPHEYRRQFIIDRVDEVDAGQGRIGDRKDRKPGGGNSQPGPSRRSQSGYFDTCCACAIALSAAILAARREIGKRSSNSVPELRGMKLDPLQEI